MFELLGRDQATRQKKFTELRNCCHKDSTWFVPQPDGLRARAFAGKSSKVDGPVTGTARRAIITPALGIKKSSPLKDELRRLDQAEWRREAMRLTPSLAIAIFAPVFAYFFPNVSHTGWWAALTISVTALAYHAIQSYQRSIGKRFQSPKLSNSWKTCEDRLARFRKAVAKLRKAHIADFEQMPVTIERVSESLYLGLRRADILLREVTESEGTVVANMMFAAPPHPTQDHVASQLYQIADRNAAEYRQRLNGVLAGVERTEAQAAVFVTTLDTLRMKMLGHRVSGSANGLSNNEFLSALGEAKLQLEAIDKALDELEINPFGPASTVPIPPTPEAAEETRRAEQDIAEARVQDQV